MVGKESFRAEELSGWRKGADRLVGLGNVVDVFTIGIGVIIASAPAVAFGILGLVGGKFVREEVIRKKPTWKMA